MKGDWKKEKMIKNIIKNKINKKNFFKSEGFKMEKLIGISLISFDLGIVFYNLTLLIHLI